jgi:hypothetical protein
MQNKNQNKNLMLAVAVAAVAIIAFAILYSGAWNQQPAGAHANATSNATVKPKEFSVELRSAQLEARLAEIIASSNQTEGVRKPDLPAETFAQLPPFPKDFYRVELLNRYNHLTDEEIVGMPQKYWKQPEWYTGFQASGHGYYVNVSGVLGGIAGYGAYKADQWATVRPGENFTVVFYVHASWGIKSYQGLQLVPEYNASEFEMLNATPDIFLLTPTLPAFTQNWTRKIVVTGKVRSDASPGEYVVALGAGVPPEEWAAQWRDIYTYAEPTFQMGFGRPLFQLHLTVAEKMQ